MNNKRMNSSIGVSYYNVLSVAKQDKPESYVCSADCRGEGGGRQQIVMSTVRQLVNTQAETAHSRQSSDFEKQEFL